LQLRESSYVNDFFAKIRAVVVITVVEATIARYGAPEHLRSDSRPELIA
jgi:hypothetical protein